MDWHDMLPTQRHSPPYRIQWSPTGHVRAKSEQDPDWKITACRKAEYAETIGITLLQKEVVKR
jgi:hypothetical protein